MKIRESHSESFSAKVFLYHNQKEGYIVVSIPDIFWSMAIDDEVYGEALTDQLMIHLFNNLDEKEAHELALRITQWIQEV